MRGATHTGARRRLLFEAPHGADRVHTARLEAQFAEVGVRETRAIRRLAVVMSSVGFIIAVVFYPYYLLYWGGLAASVVSVAVLFWAPQHSTKIIAYLYLPAAAGALRGARHSTPRAAPAR